MLLCLGLLILVDQSIGFYVRQAIYTDIQKLPYRPYGLVLGTSKYFAKNTLNLFYYNRLLATHELFKAKKIDYLLLSGDNQTIYYNEPVTMYKDLKKWMFRRNLCIWIMPAFVH